MKEIMFDGQLSVTRISVSLTQNDLMFRLLCNFLYIFFGSTSLWNCLHFINRRWLNKSLQAESCDAIEDFLCFCQCVDFHNMEPNVPRFPPKWLMASNPYSNWQYLDAINIPFQVNQMILKKTKYVNTVFSNRFYKEILML